MTMTLAEAFLTVIELAQNAEGSFAEHTPQATTDEAIGLVKSYAREMEGVEFPGDDDMGAVTIMPGMKVIFMPLAKKPPKDRPVILVPTNGFVGGAIGPFDKDFASGFIYRVVLDDGHGTMLWASREELQPVANSLAKL